MCNKILYVVFTKNLSKKKHIKNMWKNQRSQRSQFISLLIYSISSDFQGDLVKTVAFLGLLHVVALNTNFVRGSGGTSYCLKYCKSR
jgi:hypothetical protein